MSVALLLRDSTRITVLAVCLLALPTMAQQVARPDQSGVQAYSATTQSGTQSQAEVTSAPQPKNASSKLSDYSKGKRHFPAAERWAPRPVIVFHSALWRCKPAQRTGPVGQPAAPLSEVQANKRPRL